MDRSPETTELLTLQEVAALAEIPEKSVIQALCRDGVRPARTEGGWIERHSSLNIRFERGAVESWLTQQGRKPVVTGLATARERHADLARKAYRLMWVSSMLGGALAPIGIAYLAIAVEFSLGSLLVSAVLLLVLWGAVTAPPRLRRLKAQL